MRVDLKRMVLAGCLVFGAVSGLGAQVAAHGGVSHGGVSHASWRAATEAELAQALPARAPVEKERIETEMRTASGIVDGAGHLTAGVVLITAGYSADGKYSHYFVVGSTLQMGATELRPGKYVFGWKRVPEGLDVTFFDAATGVERGRALARQLPAGVRVEAFRMVPPGERAVVQIGRFGIGYEVR